MASEETQTQQTNNNIQAGTSTPKSLQRKSTKNALSTTKKVSRRGMGVAKLERLRLQERWKKMTDFNQLDSLQLKNNSHDFPTTFNYLFNGGIPMQHGGVPVMGSEKNFHVVSPQNVVVDPYRNGDCIVHKANENSNVDLSSRVSHLCDFSFKGVEVIAVHRKGNSGVFMEYEFFPEKRDRGTHSMDLLAAADPCVAFADQSCGETSSSPTSVDLSLKL